MQQTVNEYSISTIKIRSNQAPSEGKKFKHRKEQKQEQIRLAWSISLQQAYEQANDQRQKDIFENQILEKIEEFILDKYNHYVIQCVLNVGTPEHKRKIQSIVIQKKHCFWKKKYAYKVIQQCLQDKDCVERDSLVNYIQNNIETFKYDQYGNLIINQLLQSVEDEEQFKMIIEKLDLEKIKYHQYGCLIVIKVVELSNQKNPKIQEQITSIIDGLIENSIELSKSQYSNYVIQKMLASSSLDFNKKLLNEYLIPNFMIIAMDKYGSNVCEKVLEVALAYQLQYLWTQTLRIHFVELINDKYANYVMQTYYYNIQLFSYIQEEFLQLIFDMNRLQELNQNGKIVYRYVTQSNQVGQQQKVNTQQFPYY